MQFSNKNAIYKFCASMHLSTVLENYVVYFGNISKTLIFRPENAPYSLPNGGTSFTHAEGNMPAVFWGNLQYVMKVMNNEHQPDALV